MINWKNLEKFIAPGKVVTLVMLIDGEEVGAFSFNVDSLAFKEALEAASHLDPVKVAEKKSEPAKSTKKAEISKQTRVIPTDNMDEPEPEPLDEEEDEEEEEDDNDVDKVFIPETKPMTREQIMAQQEPQGPAKEPEQIKVPDKPAQQQMQLTDEW
jgi:hypothetical protein